MSKRLIVVDDTDSRIQYGGAGWFPDAGSQDSQGNYGPSYNHTLHGTNVTNSLSFFFRGTSARIMGTTKLAKIDDTHYDPSWDCFVDNISIGATPPFQYEENNWVMCSKDGLTDGPHEIILNVSITNPNNTFWLDSIPFMPYAGDTYSSEVVKVENHDIDIQYGPDWQALGTTANMTTVHGSTARFDFKGTGLTWIGIIPKELPPTSTSGSYSIDGGDQVPFTLNGLSGNGATTQYNQAFFTTPKLPAGDHTLEVTYNGDSQHTPLTLDYLYLSATSLFIPASPLPSSTPHPKPPIGVIVGGVLGGLLFLLFVLFLGLFLIRRRRRIQEEESALPTPWESKLSPFLSFGNNALPINVPIPPRVQPLSKGRNPYPIPPSYNGTSDSRAGPLATPSKLSRNASGHDYSLSASGSSTSSERIDRNVNGLTLEKEREANVGGPDHEREVIRHQDSGVRITEVVSPTVEEIPPIYTPD